LAPFFILRHLLLPETLIRVGWREVYIPFQPVSEGLDGKQIPENVAVIPETFDGIPQEVFRRSKKVFGILQEVFNRSKKVFGRSKKPRAGGITVVRFGN
jgi:predicted CoA-binding protein